MVDTDMISFIIPFSCVDDQSDYNLPSWKKSNKDRIVLTTIEVIKNIKKKIQQDFEIVLVDNTNNFPSLNLPYLNIVKGIQYLDPDEIKANPKFSKYKIDNFNNQSMWAAMAYNIGVEASKGDYIVLQHNDIFYREDFMKELIAMLDDYAYVSADSKKISLEGYLAERDTFKELLKHINIKPEAGGYVDTDIGLADAYFFLTKREFFKDYFVDWKYGDTNHGATIKCIRENKRFVHLEPYFDNPNFDVKSESFEDHRTYLYRHYSFLTHLKGGFSEHKFSSKEWTEEWHAFMNELYYET